jgi:hypothetical protein
MNVSKKTRRANWPTLSDRNELAYHPVAMPIYCHNMVVDIVITHPKDPVFLFAPPSEHIHNGSPWRRCWLRLSQSVVWEMPWSSSRFHGSRASMYSWNELGVISDGLQRIAGVFNLLMQLDSPSVVGWAGTAPFGSSASSTCCFGPQRSYLARLNSSGVLVET